MFVLLYTETNVYCFSCCVQKPLGATDIKKKPKKLFNQQTGEMNATKKILNCIILLCKLLFPF